jgi:hypothetical protein
VSAEIVLRFDVDVDPTKVDPHDVSDWLMSLYEDEARVGNAPFVLAENHLEAEWAE